MRKQLSAWLIGAVASVMMLCASLMPAQAQSNNVLVVASCGTISPALNAGTQYLGILTVDTTGKLCTAASVSASITGFPTVQTTGTPIAVTTGGVTGTLPAGAVVVASNVGATNGAYCKLGASATTSDQLIPPNSWFAFTVGANTQLTCITSSSTTTVNMVGGSGLPTGSGAGGGSGGGGSYGADASQAFSITSSTTSTALALTGTQGAQFNLTGTFVASVFGQISNDNVNWQNVPLVNMTASIPVYIDSTVGATVVGNYQLVGSQGARFARINVTFTSGTVAGTMTATSQAGVTLGDYINYKNIIASIPIGANTIGNVNQAGTWTVQPGNTPNTSPWLTTPVPGSSGSCTPYHLANGTAASTNSNSIKGSAGTLCHFLPINTTATLYYLKVYDSATAPTCSSATGLKHVYPIPAAATGNGFAIALPFGETYASGIGYCVTGGGSDTDNTNAATGLFIEASFK